MIKKILALVGFSTKKTVAKQDEIVKLVGKEQWYKIVRDGVVYWESETSRRNKRIAEEEKVKRAELRARTGFNAQDIEINANRLMELLEEFYQFGDPTFNPKEIYIQAAEKLGFEPEYTDITINNLIGRKLVSFEYSPDPSLHIRDSIDYWRLHKST